MTEELFAKIFSEYGNHQFRRDKDKKNQMSDLYWLVANREDWGRYLKDMEVNDVETYRVKDENGKKRQYMDAIRAGNFVVGYQKGEKKPKPGVATQSIVSILQCTRATNGETVEFTKVRDLKNPIRIDFKKLKEAQDNPLSRSQVIKTQCVGSLYRLTDDEAAEVKKMINESEGENVFAQSNGVNKEVKSLLESNLQVILTGAPGTGKTYAAREVAKAVSNDEWLIETDSKDGKWKYGRIASVQFHPGYDYSDFVIGMKPVLVTEEGKEVFRDAYGKLFTTDNNDPNGETKQYMDGKRTYVSYDWKDGVFKKFAAKAQKAYDAMENKDDAPKYVFLIDEINRADLSRVFGELFSLLEEEYRYPNGKGSDFILLPNGERFSIPKNLYIIGTMNDIDRSVESMDFALRRRFAWYEVTADKSMGIIDAVDENGIRKVSKNDSDLLKVAMKKLNDIIGGEEFKVTNENDSPQNCKLRLGSEYQLGGAIFAKLEKYVQRDSARNPLTADKGAFDKIWNNHIENILLEYLRGQSNRTDLLKGLKQVFDDAVKGIDKQGESGQTGDSATVDKNSAIDSKSQS